MKLSIIILMFLLISCTKENIQPYHYCELCIEISDKYRLSDSVYLRTDTLEWSPGEKQRRLCDSTLNAFKLVAASQINTFNLCSLGLLEKRRFIYKP